MYLDWYHKDKFNRDKYKDLNYGKGLARTVNGINFLQIYDTGHMLPLDQPEVALNMIKVIVTGVSC